MYERKKINISDLNPELETALERLIQEIAPFIPEKKKTELEEIIKSQTDYISELLEKLRNIGLFIHDAKNGKVYPNKYWYEWGYREDEMMGQRFFKHIYPEDLHEVKNLTIVQDTVGHESSNVAFRFHTKDGDWRWILSIAVSVAKDETGRVKQYIGFDMDITEEKEAKEKLKKALKETQAAKEKAEAHALEADTMREISRIISSSLDFDSTIDAILDQAKRLIPFDTASVQILKDDYLQNIGGRGWKNLGTILRYSLPVPGDNPNTVVIESKEPLIIRKVPDRYSSFKELPDEYAGKSWLGIPLIFRESVIGLLTFDKNEENFFSSKHAELGTVFAGHVAVALNNSRIFEQTKARAMTDPLTGAKNRRAFFDFAIQEDKIYKRYGTVFSIIMIDIDFFKKINDRYGHQTGDKVLKDLVSLIKNDLRDSDIICRYGGEEFIILLPASDEKAAYDIVERIRKNVEANLKTGESNSRITISTGCADRQGTDIHTIDSLISMADKALYHAKRSGRNRSVRYSKLLL